MIGVRVAPRVALLADTFYEVNGAARTCREWESYARRHSLPFFSVRWGKSPGFHEDGPVWAMDLVRSPFAIRIDPDLYFDSLFWRQLKAIEEQLRRFDPDIIHVTSPGDLGISGFILARKLKKQFALSWHTNLHEFAARRIHRTLAFVPSFLRARIEHWVERFTLDRIGWFFSRGDLAFAPNPELIGLVHSRTGKPVFPMGRGVDTDLFSPERRARTDNDLVLGFVGRLMPEKDVRLLVRVAEALTAAGITGFRFQISGSGSERPWLERHLPVAVFTGVLRGEALARAYANMDVFVFPSRTDTFGNVVQEALASGVPAVVSDAGGPRFIVSHGANGLIAANQEEFCAAVVALARDETLRKRMGGVARRSMLQNSWDHVFEEVYDGYAAVRQPA